MFLTIYELANYKNHKGNIYHSYYSVSYDTDDKSTKWVAYELLDEEVRKNVSIVENYQADPLINSDTNFDDDYKDSGYEKGHLMGVENCRLNETTMKEGYYYTNIVPMTKDFKNGAWKRLIEEEQWIAKKFTKAWVVNVPIYSSNSKEIGKNKLRVPDKFAKVFLVKVDGFNSYYYGSCALLVDYNQGPTFGWEEIAVTVDSIEKMANIDIFFNLEDSLEVSIESHIFVNMLR